MVNGLHTIREIAQMWGIRPETVGEIIKIHKIPTYRIPHNGVAKGLDEEGITRLRKLLTYQTTTT